MGHGSGKKEGDSCGAIVVRIVEEGWRAMPARDARAQKKRY